MSTLNRESLAGRKRRKGYGRSGGVGTTYKGLKGWTDRQFDWLESLQGSIFKTLKLWRKQLASAWRERQAPRVVVKPGVRDLLGRGGWTMLALFAARLVTTLLPYRIFEPDWYVRLGIELINSSPVMLTGFALLASVGVLNARGKSDQQPRRAIARACLQAAMWVYVLIIPVQLLASVLADQRFQARLDGQATQVKQQLAIARKQQLTSAQLQQLQQAEARLEEQRSSGRRQLRFNLTRELLRVILSAVALVWALRLPLVVLNDRKTHG